MRRIMLGAALTALLALAVAAPAGAVPANEILIAKNLQRLGVIPGYADSTMARSAVQALDLRESRYVAKPAAGKRTAGKALGKFLAARVLDPSATRTYTSNTLVLLVEFGDDAWPEGDSTGHVLAGPAHGSIAPPWPDDNFTFWPGDFSTMHYQQMLFGNSYPIYDAAGALRGTSDDTMRNYYLEQSHGTYTVSGDIGDWVMLDLPESWYGADSEVGTDDLTGDVWRVARDAIVAYAAAHPDFDWAQYDQENPWGITGSDFRQPDGYLDHLILIHAGSDQSAGGGAEGTDSIWAHSWGIYENYSGGPGDGPGMMIPGTEGLGPQGLGIWAYNYTINPEDGDVGVFCHEFGHDLGLSDQYDYSSYTGDATSGFWTIMGSGSWLGRQWGGGSQPSNMNADDKTYLGFTQPKVVKRGKTATVKLLPSTDASATRTAVKVPLPKAKHIQQLSGKDGATEWYSTSGNDLDVTIQTKAAVPVPAGDPTLTFRTWYDIETGYDYGFVDVSADGGATWTNLESFTGADTDNWTQTRSYDLSAFAGGSVLVRFEYYTDGGVANLGWEVTDIKVGGAAIAPSAFANDGWVRVDGAYTQYTERYYIAEYRTFEGFDASLKYCYQWNPLYYSWVDRFSYNKGLHLIYRDTYYSDNDVAMHLGRGGWMVVDARPMPDGVDYNTGAEDLTGYWRPRIQVRDASFSLKPTKTQSIYFTDYDNGYYVGEKVAPGKLAQPWFKDSRTYWYAETPEAGTKIPKNLGVRIQVKAMTADAMTIWVDNKK